MKYHTRLSSLTVTRFLLDLRGEELLKAVIHSTGNEAGSLSDFVATNMDSQGYPESGVASGSRDPSSHTMDEKTIASV